MRIAFLITCHKNADQINVLTERLSSCGDDVYIHVDKKSTLDRTKLVVGDHVKLLTKEESITVGWAEFSQCEATLALIRLALSSGIEYDYIWLLSGQDFPIKSMAEIRNVLSQDLSVPYIDVIPREKVERLAFDKRNDLAHPMCLIGKKPYQRVLRRVWYLLSGGKRKTWFLFQKARPVEQLHYGSSWWCLPCDCVKQMMVFLELTDGYNRYFSSSLCSDESFFQTLFMQTDYAGRQVGNRTYIDWSKGESSPKTFTKEDYPTLSNLPQRYLLARKVDFATDPELAELLKNI